MHLGFANSGIARESLTYVTPIFFHPPPARILANQGDLQHRGVCGAHFLEIEPRQIGRQTTPDGRHFANSVVEIAVRVA